MTARTINPVILTFYLGAMLFCLLLALPAAAQTNVVFMHVTADFAFDLFCDPSPSPVCWLYWEEYLEGNLTLPELHRSYVEEEDPCSSSWLVHCDSDSMSYHGAWPEIEPEEWYWNWQAYNVELAGHVYLSANTLVMAERAVLGVPSTDDHQFLVSSNNGPDIVLLGPGTEDYAEVVLEPGAYWYTLTVNAAEYGTHYAYSGSVHVRWEDAGNVASEHVAWGTVKALYR